MQNIIMFYLNVIILLLFIHITSGKELCDRRPLGTKAASLPPDDRFFITVDGIIGDHYIANKTYTVTLTSSDQKSTFIAFSIWIGEDTRENPKNIRKPILLKPGTIYPSPDNDDSRLSEDCSNTVIQNSITPKTSVQVVWKAPPKDQGCVTIYAVVAVKPDVWYNDEGPLVKKICEDQRQIEDMQPILNNNCTICEEALYMLTCEGSWTYNTHATFPTNRELARFSDLVGASHNNRYELWKFNKEASLGLQMLAEQGNTTKLEMEIQEQYLTNPRGIRTIIKAKGQTNPNTATHSIFRVNRDFHRISVVTAILPSPDWFLGVADLELCNTRNQWADDIIFNLYPLDAGTDSGKDFESPNEETSPPQPISRVLFHTDKNEVPPIVKPFAKLKINLLRTYDNPECRRSISKDVDDDTENNHNVYTESVASIEDISEGPENTYKTSSDIECPMSDWEEWLPCDGPCEDGKIQGFQTRIRYHLVDGEPVDKYDAQEYKRRKYYVKEVPEICRETFPDSETRECEEICDTDTEDTQI